MAMCFQFCRRFSRAIMQMIVYSPRRYSLDSMFDEEWKHFSHGTTFRSINHSHVLIIHFLLFSGFQSFSFFALVGVCLSPHYSLSLYAGYMLLDLLVSRDKRIVCYFFDLLKILIKFKQVFLRLILRKHFWFINN